MRVLVTRPGTDGQAVVELLSDLGIESVLEPLLTVRNLDIESLDINGVQAYLSTSANGVRALVNTNPDFSIPLFAVGNATAITARHGGFKTVHSASGDVAALANLVADILDPSNGSLIHAVGASQAGNIRGELEKYGFEYREEILYETDPSKSLTPATVAAMKDGSIGAILLYSPRTADVFLNLLRKSRLVRTCRNVTAVCLSQAVAAKIANVSWEEIVVAAKPTQDALLNSLTKNLDVENLNQIKKHELTGRSEPIDTLSTENVVTPIQKSTGNSVKTVFITLLAVSILISVGSATLDIWLPKIQDTLPFLSLGDKNEKQLVFLIERLKKLESQAINNTPRLEELEAERIRLQTHLDTTLDRVNNVESSIKMVKQMISAVDTSAGPDGAQKTLKMLGERLTILESDRSSKTFKNQRQIGQLANQVAKLEQKAPHSATDNINTQARAFLLAVGQLRSAIRLGRPFSNELSSLGTFGLGSKVIVSVQEDLVGHANIGIPTLMQLRETFKDLAAKIVQSDQLPKSDSLLNRTINRLSQSIKWRRTDNFEGKSVEAIVARAERALQNYQIQAAVKELSTLGERSAVPVQQWLQNAKALIAADKALAALQVKAISLLMTKE